MFCLRSLNFRSYESCDLPYYVVGGIYFVVQWQVNNMPDERPAIPNEPNVKANNNLIAIVSKFADDHLALLRV